MLLAPQPIDKGDNIENKSNKEDTFGLLRISQCNT